MHRSAVDPIAVRNKFLGVNIVTSFAYAANGGFSVCNIDIEYYIAASYLTAAIGITLNTVERCNFEVVRGSCLGNNG